MNAHRAFTLTGVLAIFSLVALAERLGVPTSMAVIVFYLMFYEPRVTPAWFERAFDRAWGVP